METEPTPAYLQGNTYDTLKKIVEVGLPILGSFCFIVGSISNASHLTEILGFCLVLTALLGVTLQISSSRYQKDNQGELVVHTDADGVKSFSLQLPKEPEELAQMDRVSFKVQPANYLDE
jgi:hypothetical protein